MTTVHRSPATTTPAQPPATTTPAEPPAEPARDSAADSYYGQPIIKPPPWSHEIPAYLFAGGLAGASAGLGFAARLAGNDRLARSATFTGLGAVAVSPILLIADLGRPERFYNMLRVFKPTSPMNLGTWILSGTGGLLGIAAGCELLGILPRVRLLAQGGAAVLGMALSTYTAALLADTAVPSWHEGRRELPFVFAGSSAAAAGGAATIATAPLDAGPARRLAVGGALVELAAFVLHERHLGPLLSEPYRRGSANRLRSGARAATLAGSVVLLAAGRHRAGGVAGGSLLLAGSLLARLATFSAGLESARDPRYTVLPQRARLETRAESA